MKKRRDGVRVWVWRGLGGLASDALIIDQLGEDKHAHWRHRWLEKVEVTVWKDFIKQLID